MSNSQFPLTIVKSVQGRRFDSEIVIRPGSNCDLILKLTLWFKQVKAGLKFDVDSHMFATEKWNEADWRTFVQNAAAVAQTFWSDRYCLRTPEKCCFLDYKSAGRTFRPNIRCLLQVTGSVSGGHIGIEVAKLAPDSAGREFRSHSKLFTQADIIKKTRPARQNLPSQTTAIHEAGHALGLAHIGVLNANPVCLAGMLHDENGYSNLRPCYGVTPIEKDSIMGWGENLGKWEALPWQKRITEHVNGPSYQHWVPVLAQEPPVMRLH